MPADARVVKLLSSTLSVDEGSLTGESATVPKSLVATFCFKVLLLSPLRRFRFLFNVMEILGVLRIFDAAHPPS